MQCRFTVFIINCMVIHCMGLQINFNSNRTFTFTGKKNITNHNCHFNNSIMEPNPNNKPTNTYNKCAWPHFNRVLCESNEFLVSVILKGSYDVAKKNILGIWCNAMCLCGLRFKKHYFPHTVHYCCTSKLRHKAHRSEKCALIGQLSGAL